MFERVCGGKPVAYEASPCAKAAPGVKSLISGWSKIGLRSMTPIQGWTHRHDASERRTIGGSLTAGLLRRL